MHTLQPAKFFYAMKWSPLVPQDGFIPTYLSTFFPTYVATDSCSLHPKASQEQWIGNWTQQVIYDCGNLPQATQIFVM